MVRSTPPPSMPAAANAAVMLVEQASTAENAGTLGLSLASSQISRAILLQTRLGITRPQQTRSGSARYRSEERRGGKECDSTGKLGWSRVSEKKKEKNKLT